ncbi:MAG: hypothetical protein L6N96_06965, partial [Candidatus Methylarchaceae archaeon HK02M2]|nr:hypothetical protein [Candidatus Methylarchaceae archaeon HK02M2]
LLRPGRFDRLLYIPAPDLEARKAILRIHTKRKPLVKDLNLDKLAELTDGYTGADLAALCNMATMSAIREHLNKYETEKESKEKAKELKVTMEHFNEALEKVNPIPKQELDMYKEVSKRFSRTFPKSEA